MYIYVCVCETNLQINKALRIKKNISNFQKFLNILIRIDKK